MPKTVLNIGDTLLQFRIVRLLGRHDGGELYEAEDLTNGRSVAIELFRSSGREGETITEELWNAVRTLGDLIHPNICQVFSAHNVGNQLFVVMELVQGSSLDRVVAGKPLSTELLVPYAVKITSALDALHAEGFLYRKLKPASISVVTSGPKLLFSVGMLADSACPESAAALDLTLTQRDASGQDEEMRFCTHLSPEQAAGLPVDARSDIFSLGAVLYEMATGTPAFFGRSADQEPRDLLLESPPTPRSLNPAIPEDLERIILKAIEKERDRRFQSASEMLVELKRLEANLARPEMSGDATPIVSDLAPLGAHASVAPQTPANNAGWQCKEQPSGPHQTVDPRPRWARPSFAVAAVAIIAFAMILFNKNKPANQDALRVPSPTRALNPEPLNLSPQGTPELRTGKYYALVIGINQYPDPLPKLATAVADAKAVASALHDQYGFEVKTLIDGQATRSNILDALFDYRSRFKPEDHDNLLIYYAGHGYYDKEADKAYWLPVDANSSWSSNRISADDLTSCVKAQPARHVLIISDSCYSGDISRDLGMVTRQADDQAYLTYLGKMLASRSRTIMASGGDEPVSDRGGEGHSVFAYALLEALKNPDVDMFTAGDLFSSHLKQRVGGSSHQQPRYDLIQNSGHEEGDFVFVRLPAAPKSQ